MNAHLLIVPVDGVLARVAVALFRWVLSTQPCGSLQSILEKLPNKSNAVAQSDAHFRVMRIIEANPTFSQRDIARSLGISLGAVNYCLSALVAVGFVKVRNFRASDKKLRYAYILTPKGAAEKAALTGTFLQRKLQEYEALKAEIQALREEARFEANSAGKRR